MMLKLVGSGVRIGDKGVANETHYKLRGLLKWIKLVVVVVVVTFDCSEYH